MKQKLLLIFLCLFAGIKASAYDAEIDGIYYNFSGEEAEVTCGNALYSGAVVIPESVTYNSQTYTVTSIGSRAFDSCSDLTSIYIPNSVKSISIKAFADCTGLTSVMISDLLAWCNINFFNSESNPLYYAHKLYLNGEEITELVIPEGVHYIKSCAFAGYSGMTSVIIPEGVVEIAAEAFNNCSNLTSAILPESLTTIYSNAFYSCSGLTTITFPENVRIIGNAAFGNCANLMDVRAKMKTPPNIDVYTFDNTTYSQGVLRVPVGCLDAYKQTSGWKAFKNILEDYPEIDGIRYYLDNETMTAEVKSTYPVYSGDIVIPSTITYDGLTYTVTSIGESTFNGCSSLTSVILPESLTSIGRNAFYKCSSLTSITLPENVSTIGNSAFGLCNNLVDVTVKMKTPPSIAKGTFSNYRNATLHVPVYSGDAYNQAQYWKDFMEILSFDPEVDGIFYFLDMESMFATVIGSETEYSGDIVIPSTITYWGDIYTVNSIEDYAFSGSSSLTSVTIPETVTRIGYMAFTVCSFLTDVFCMAQTVPQTESNAFDNTPTATATLHVPAGSIEAYKTTSPWSSFGRIVSLSGSAGDLNGDSKIDIADAVSVLDLMAEGKDDPAADLNGDGKVDIADFVSVLDLMAGQ
ncbi:MAG: leucine-rich repeat protein [Bacteroidaceae bacterium]|nr:leucine-rich repeat protein [Bacteroidaceae bacterium]